MSEEQEAIRQLNASLEQALADVEKWRQAAINNKVVAEYVIRQFMYMCLKWLDCLKLFGEKGKTSWATRRKAVERWFITAEERLPRSKQEIREEVRQLKDKLMSP